jgi:hypothetical protein
MKLDEELLEDVDPELLDAPCELPVPEPDPEAPLFAAPEPLPALAPESAPVLADTASPGVSWAIEATVPSTGAFSFVLAKASSAPTKLALALSTAASSLATLAALAAAD